MVALSTLLLVVGLTLAIYYFFFSESGNKGKKFPPGPRGLPYVGNLFSLGNRPHLVFTEWAKKYGPIVMMQLGRSRTLLLNDVKLIKEAFNDPILSGRPDNKAFNIVSGGKIGIISADGEDWLEQRRFTLRNLRDFGFGKKNMEDMIMEEVTEILDFLKKGAGKPISVNRKFQLAVLNSLWQIMTSERYSHDDPKLTNILDTAIKSFDDISESGFALFFPELAEWFPNVSGWNNMLTALEPMINLFKTTVENRLKNPGDENNPRDFMDVYVNEINKTTNPTSSFYKDTGVKSMQAVIGDLHGAGSETTSTTLTWAILYLMKYPEIQAKLRTEIDKVVGKSRLPSLADKANMPYTEALMMEIFRMSSIVPMGVFHTSLADTTFHGYFIPKDTLIIANQHFVHFDPKNWGDPHNFRPERFLSKDGKTVVKNEALIPFSVGKRVCLGETLARDEFFLFLTSIFQRFQVDPDPAQSASFESKVGFISAAKPFTVVMTDRLE